ncbi:MAG: IS1380 family transposase [Desulfobaccales bacterium]
MLANGESQKEAIRPDFNRAIMIDLQGATITSDVGFFLLREIDDRFKIIAPMGDCLEDFRSSTHTRHSLIQIIRQRVYQIAAGYEDCNDADYLRIDPALKLAIGKDHQAGASQSMLSRLENDVRGNAMGLEALDGALIRTADALLKRKNKRRLIIDLDSTEDPAHGKQEGVAYNGHFAKNCFHPLFCFTSEGDCLRARLRPGNVHSADGVLEFMKPMVERFRACFKLFWFWGDAAFSNPETYEYCEDHRITYFIRLPSNAILMRLLEPHLNRSVGRAPKSGIQVKVVDLQYQAKSWHKLRRVVAKIEWHRGELFPRIGFVVTNSRLPAAKVIKVYNGRAEIENRIKEGKNTLRWDKTSCQKFEANQARLQMGVSGLQPPAYDPAVLCLG